MKQIVYLNLAILLASFIAHHTLMLKPAILSFI
jgi:hypothetical protein